MGVCGSVHPSYGACYGKLVQGKEIKFMDEKGNKIYAVDFDGTLCEDAWPGIGKPNWPVIKFVIEEKMRGARNILWTCRTGNLLSEAVVWCRGYGIEFDAVNANLPELVRYYGNDCRKVNADFYIDDKSVNPFTVPKAGKGSEHNIYREVILREDVYNMLSELGGCDAEDEFSIGWDTAIDQAIKELEKL